MQGEVFFSFSFKSEIQSRRALYRFLSFFFLSLVASGCKDVDCHAQRGHRILPLAPVQDGQAHALSCSKHEVKVFGRALTVSLSFWEARGK